MIFLNSFLALSRAPNYNVWCFLIIIYKEGSQNGQDLQVRKVKQKGCYRRSSICLALILAIVAGFFIYISGILPKTLTGVSITETLTDGTTKTVKNYSVLETNFHFQEVYDSYSQYGMVAEEHLDEVYDTSTGETYRDWLLRETATQMKTLALVERAAQQNGFMEYSKARAIAAKNLETLDLYAMMYGFGSGQQYLQALFGTGMTRRLYIEFQAREALVEEYGYYLQQFDPSVVPTDEQVQARFDADPYKYYVCDYNYFFVSADKDADGKVVDPPHPEKAGKGRLHGDAP